MTICRGYLNQNLQSVPQSKIGASSSTKIGAPSSTKIGAPSSTKIGAPSSTKIGAPSSTKIGAPSSTKIGAPSSTKIGAPSSTKIGAPSSTKIGASSSTKKKSRNNIKPQNVDTKAVGQQGDWLLHALICKDSLHRSLRSYLSTQINRVKYSLLHVYPRVLPEQVMGFGHTWMSLIN